MIEPGIGQRDDAGFWGRKRKQQRQAEAGAGK
jgi:hypothetical protein